MKFIVSSTLLHKQLQAIIGVINTNNTLPILDHFLFHVSDETLKVSASDLETSVTTFIQLEKSDKSGSVAVPARLLLDTLKTFPELPLTFMIDNKTGSIEVTSEFGKYKFTGQNAGEFPKIPVMSNSSSIEVPASLLYNGINKTHFATGNDDMRPVMAGVFFSIDKNALTFVATDAHKLVRYRRKDAHSEMVSSFIIHKKPLNLLKNLLASLEAPVTIEYNDSNAFFAFDNIHLVCRLIEGKYPNYEAVIPKENPNKLTIDRTAFLNSMRRVSIFSSKSSHQVRLKITGNNLVVSAEDLDFSNEANERVNCEYSGEDMDIGFNSRFVIEMLQNLESDNITLEMSSPSRAGILVPCDKKDENEDLLMLVMPIMLNN